MNSLKNKVFSDASAHKVRQWESEMGTVLSAVSFVSWPDFTARGELAISPGAASGKTWGTPTSGHQPVKGKVGCRNQLCSP